MCYPLIQSPTGYPPTGTPKGSIGINMGYLPRGGDSGREHPRGGPKLAPQEVPTARRFFFLGQIGYGEEDGTGPGTWGL